MTKRLQRSNDRVFGGVCAGFAEYLGFDPVAVRLAYGILTLCTLFPGIIIYIVAWIVAPVARQAETSNFSEKQRI